MLSEGASPAKPQLPIGGGGRRKKGDWNGGIGGRPTRSPPGKRGGGRQHRDKGERIGNIYGQDAFIKEKGTSFCYFLEKVS